MKHISPSDMLEMLGSKSLDPLIDVREPFEHEAFNIGGELIPLGELMRHADRIPKDVPVIVYCRKGVRSQVAIQRLEQKGFTNLINLQGGVEALQKLMP